jgi:hypothetical protein
MYSQTDLDQLLSRGQISQAAYMQGVQSLQASGGLGLDPNAAQPAPQAPPGPAPDTTPAPAAPQGPGVKGLARLFTGQAPLSPPQSPGIGGFVKSYMQPPLPAPLDGDSPESPAPKAEKPKKLTETPAGPAGAAAPANPAANVPGLDPRIMASLSAGGPQQTRAVGLSAADRKDLKEREELQARRQEEATGALDALKTNADTTKEQSETLALDTQLAAFNAKKDQEKDNETMGRVRTDAKEASTRLQTELADMQAQGIDPNRYWQNSGTASKIGAALAVGLGAFGAQMGHGGQNAALQIIDGAINRDMEAQKANLSKNMQVMQLKANKAGQDFDMGSAMAKAERESHQASWAVALADLDRRASLFKDNAQAQNQYQQLRAGIVQRMQEGEEGKIQNEYQVRKGAERQVAVGGGSSGPTSKEVLAKADKLVDDYAQKGIPIARPQAMRLALEGLTGSPMGPEGFAQMPAMPQKGAAEGKESPRIATRIAEYTTRIGELEKAKKLAENGTWSPGDRSAYATIRASMPPDVALPENPFGVHQYTGAPAAIQQAIDSENAKLRNLRIEVPKASSGGAEPETP